MALVDFRSKTDKGGAKADKRAAPGPVQPLDQAQTFLDEGCELSGQLRFKDSVQIDGKIEGEIECAKSVIIGSPADIRASISAECVVISGAVTGDIAARRKITLHKTAHVTGDMRTAGIVIEEGARFKGSIVIGADEPQKSVRPAAPEHATPGSASAASGNSAAHAP
jgi:cytoskeletal protein CcmA (bactofilin family)